MIYQAAAQKWSDDFCGLGLTATLYDNNGEQVYQGTHGSKYSPMREEYMMYGPFQDGWDGDTVFPVYSNTKIASATTFIASVVDTNLGYLDEPLRVTFTELEESTVGQITPRMILSHTSGLKTFNRGNLTDPFYACIYDGQTTNGGCVLDQILSDDNLIAPPGNMTIYNNAAFDILAVSDDCNCTVLKSANTHLTLFSTLSIYLPVPCRKEDRNCQLWRSIPEVSRGSAWHAQYII